MRPVQNLTPGVLSMIEEVLSAVGKAVDPAEGLATEAELTDIENHSHYREISPLAGVIFQSRGD